MNRFNVIDTIALVLLIVGGLNWGSVGLTGVNIVDSIFGSGSALSSIIYVLVGVASLYAIYTTYKLNNNREMDTSR